MNDKKIDPSVVGANKKAAFTKFVQAFTQSASSIIAQCNSWFILADSCITPSIRFDANPVEALELRFGVLIKGLTIAMRVNNLMKSYIVMHEVMMEPIGKSALQDIGALIELLKAIEYTFTRKQTDIALGYSLIMRLFSEEILKVVQPIRNRLEATRKVDNAKSAVLATMNLLVNILRSSDSMQFARMATVQFTVDMLGEVDGFAERDVDKIRLVVKRMSLLSSLSKSVRATCDTQFLYFHRGILVHLVNQIYNCPTAPSRLHYIVGAYSNGARACNSVMHYPGDASMFVKNYRQFITACIKKGIVDPLCREIEKDLRLQVHTKTLSHMQAVNPKTENLRPLRPFLDLTPLRYLGVVFDIKATVSHYLDHNFYSLTTIALHDWRTYSDMKALAADKFGLALVDSFLPMGSLDQGLDVLQIMRNINVFVCRFTYNMNMQQFIEFRHDKASKHLNTINIQSIAASIRQHGLGMLNTTVNFTYQFLAQKFNVFSQFIFDDYIRGHLSREARWYKKHRNDAEVNGIYPYERGLKFAKDIRKLGVTDAGKSYLDQFRMLITEIGNALGYVRMVRSASMYFCSEAVKYLPDLDDIIKFEPYANKGVPLNEEDVEPDTTIPGTGANLSAETIDSAKMLDGVIDNLIKNFGEGSDYFKVLVNVFQPVLLTDEQEHLKTFFMIVPSLCISWVEASLQAKDLMYKANKGILSKEMYFTDDGFAMGVAYCLAILKQTRRFESLHWFDGMQAKLNADEEELKKKQEIRCVYISWRFHVFV
jgi:WASH complex subunit 7